MENKMEKIDMMKSLLLILVLLLVCFERIVHRTEIYYVCKVLACHLCYPTILKQTRIPRILLGVFLFTLEVVWFGVIIDMW